MSSPLAQLINLSLKTGKVPTQMKTARVVPIYKGKGEKKSPSSYRPISILPPVSKIMEKIVKSRLLEYLDHGNYFSSYQYGFRSKLSTLSATTDLVIKIQEALDKNKISSGIFIDFAKAFDTVNHPLLIYK